MVQKGTAHNKCLPHQLSFIVNGEGQGFGRVVGLGQNQLTQNPPRIN